MNRIHSLTEIPAKVVYEQRAADKSTSFTFPDLPLELREAIHYVEGQSGIGRILVSRALLPQDQPTRGEPGTSWKVRTAWINLNPEKPDAKILVLTKDANLPTEISPDGLTSIVKALIARDIFNQLPDFPQQGLVRQDFITLMQEQHGLMSVYAEDWPFWMGVVKTLERSGESTENAFTLIQAVKNIYLTTSLHRTPKEVKPGYRYDDISNKFMAVAFAMFEEQSRKDFSWDHIQRVFDLFQIKTDTQANRIISNVINLTQGNWQELLNRNSRFFGRAVVASYFFNRFENLVTENNLTTSQAALRAAKEVVVAFSYKIPGSVNYPTENMEKILSNLPESDLDKVMALLLRARVETRLRNNKARKAAKVSDADSNDEENEE